MDGSHGATEYRKGAGQLVGAGRRMGAPMRIAAACGLAAVLVTGPAGLGRPVARAAGSAFYQVAAVGSLGGNYSQAFGLNDSGEAVGWAGNTIPDPLKLFPTESRAVVWTNGAPTDLGTIGGGPDAYAQSINDAGQIVGYSPTDADGGGKAGASSGHATLWYNGKTTDLGSLGGKQSAGLGIAQNGAMVGFSTLLGDKVTHATLWYYGQITDLGTLGGANSSASGITDAGQIVGQSDLTTTVDPALGFPDAHAVLWAGGAKTDLGTLPGAHFSAATAINQWAVVGYSNLAGDKTHHATRWVGGHILDLGTVPGDLDSVAEGVGPLGTIVGESGSAKQEKHAFLWSFGNMFNLNQLIPSGSGWQLLEADTMNAGGQIVGLGIYHGQMRGFILTPSSGLTAAPQAVPNAGDLGPAVTEAPLASASLPVGVTNLLSRRAQDPSRLPGR